MACTVQPLNVETHKMFDKNYQRRFRGKNASRVARLLRERLEMLGKLLSGDIGSSHILNEHPLSGTKGLRAFALGGDIRVVYRRLFNGAIQLLDIGSHNQVYNSHNIYAY